MTKQTAGYLVDQLERAGYVERVADPPTRALAWCASTDKTRALRPLTDKVGAEVEDEWTAHLGKPRMDQLRDILTRLREITDPYLDR